MPTYFVQTDVEEAMREAVSKARKRGHEEGYAEARRFIELAQGLNGSTHAILKALGGDDGNLPVGDRGVRSGFGVGWLHGADH